MDLVHIPPEIILQYTKTRGYLWRGRVDLQGFALFSMRSISSHIGTRKLSLSFRPFEKYSSALFTLLLRTGHATQPGSFTIGTFLLLTAARFDAWRQQAARPRIVNVQNDSTEWFIRGVVRRFAAVYQSASFSSVHAESRSNRFRAMIVPTS